MKLRDAEGWRKSVDVNAGDPYGNAVTQYAEAWADLMEERMAGDETMLPSIAKQASHDADTDGITGFMYGCAVSILSQVWAHGEALRRWHNLDTQIRDEGARANDKPGAVLNPAILSMGE